MSLWQMQEAKAKLSELILKTQTQGPQLITIRGKEAVIVLSVDEYNKMKAHNRNLVKFLNSSPLKGIELEINRDQSPPRNLKI